MANRRTDSKQSCNAVAQDSFWKKRVETEQKAARRWCERWGFLTTLPKESTEDKKEEDKKPEIELPEHLQVRPVTPTEIHIEVKPSSPVPRTSQGFIGWQSAVAGLELEHLEIKSCKGAFFRELNWPKEPSD